jgi:hypothetical protein
MNKNADYRGTNLQHATRQEFTGMHAARGEGLRNATLRPVVAIKSPLAEASRAHGSLFSGEITARSCW